MMLFVTRLDRKQANEEFEMLLDQPCLYHTNGKHIARHCWTFHNLFKKEVEKCKDGKVAPVRNNNDKDREDKGKQVEIKKPKENFPHPEREVNMVIGGHNSNESKRQQKLTL